MKPKRLFGLVGYPLSHSFSPRYFAQKFTQEQINDAEYLAFEEADLHGFLSNSRTNERLIGFNVTIPYKEGIIPLLDSISEAASYIGAVNTVKRNSNGQLTGYNTDVMGFQDSLEPLLKAHHTKAMILGTGGAAKAVHYVLKQLNISPLLVSRRKGAGHVTYDQITPKMIENYPIIVNTTPLGMHPNTETFPALPYQAITPNHLAYDLVYNPEKTSFLDKAEQQGATIKNGLEMLHIQAEKSWKIWNQ